MLLASWSWEEGLGACPAWVWGIRDASSAGTEEDLGEEKAMGRGLLAREWSAVLGHVCGTPTWVSRSERYRGENMSHTQERIRGVLGLLTRSWVRTWAWAGLGPLRWGGQKAVSHMG